jgi:exonuclease VII small subunit
MRFNLNNVMHKKMSQGLLILFLIINYIPGVNANEILEQVEVQEAEAKVLEAEAAMFKSIGMGLAISLAHCDEDTDCNIAVSETEIEKLLNALNDRINGLVLRLESGDTNIEDALVMYANQRDQYIQYQETLAEMTPETGAASGKVDLSIFEDADITEEKLLIDDFDPSNY